MATHRHCSLLPWALFVPQLGNTNVDLQEYKVRENTTPSPVSSGTGTWNKKRFKGCHMMTGSSSFAAFISRRQIGSQKVVSLTHTSSNNSTVSAKG